MLGAIILAVIIIVAIPVTICMTGAAVAAVLGWSLHDNGETSNEGSELIDLNT